MRPQSRISVWSFLQKSIYEMSNQVDHFERSCDSGCIRKWIFVYIKCVNYLCVPSTIHDSQLLPTHKTNQPINSDEQYWICFQQINSIDKLQKHFFFLFVLSALQCPYEMLWLCHYDFHLLFPILSYAITWNKVFCLIDLLNRNLELCWYKYEIFAIVLLSRHSIR